MIAEKIVTSCHTKNYEYPDICSHGQLYILNFWFTVYLKY